MFGIRQMWPDDVTFVTLDRNEGLVIGFSIENNLYVLMKVPGGSRRAGASSYRRFVQEESAGGLAHINLGDEPFPEFRRPSARRPGPSDRDAAAPASELEVIGPLPTDLDGEPVT